MVRKELQHTCLTIDASKLGYGITGRKSVQSLGSFLSLHKAWQQVCSKKYIYNLTIVPISYSRCFDGGQN